jgi:hypothetical protein
MVMLVKTVYASISLSAPFVISRSAIFKVLIHSIFPCMVAGYPVQNLLGS